MPQRLGERDDQPLADADEREDEERESGDAVGAERHRPRYAEPAGRDRTRDDEREVEVVSHRRRDRDRVAGPESHQRRRER